MLRRATTAEKLDGMPAEMNARQSGRLRLVPQRLVPQRLVPQRLARRLIRFALESSRLAKS
jgi:hypothetical protein